MKIGKFNISSYGILISLLILTALLYFPGLGGAFLLDDFERIVSNQTVHLDSIDAESVSGIFTASGTTFLGRPLALLSFGINYYFTQLDPSYFKLTNLLIHLLTTVVVFLFTRELIKVIQKEDDQSMSIDGAALLITAIWALHPINVSTTLYVVQRMTQLSSLFIFLGLYLYCKFRQKTDLTPIQILKYSIAFFLILVAAVLTKENGALLIPMMFLIEYFFFHFQSENQHVKKFLKYFYILGLAIPAFSALLFMIIFPDWLLAGYETRTYSLFDRLLSESRIIWLYAQWIFLPLNSSFTFYHDTFEISRSLVSPLTTLLSVIGHSLLAGLVFYRRHHFPTIAFGICFFYLGHSIESTVIALEPIFEHRNYLPSWGLVFVLVFLFSKIPSNYIGKRPIVLMAVLYLIYLVHGTSIETNKWKNQQNQLLHGFAQKPDSFRINYELARLYTRQANQGNPEYFQQAEYHFIAADNANKKSLQGILGLMMTYSQSNLAIPSETVNEVERRLLENDLGKENYIKDFQILVECWYLGLCRFEFDIMLRYFNAITKNQVSAVTDQQRFLFEIAANLEQKFGRLQDARALYYMASDLSDEFSFVELKRVEIEIQLGNYAEATQNLERALGRNPDARSLEVLEELRNRIPVI